MLKTYNKLVTLFLLTILALQTSFATAAEKDDQFATAFAGNWITYSNEFSESGLNCILEFSDTKVDQSFPITTNGCVGALNNVRGWVVINGQLRLVDKAEKEIATLGGNQFRLSGLDAESGNTFIIEKEAQAQAISKARKSISCSYLGYGKKCAEPRDYAAPTITKDGEAEVTILISLNARVEPRPDAQILGVLNQNSCMKVNACSQASDGLWCKANFGEKSGWFKKHAVRRGKWPVLTFISGCK